MGKVRTAARTDGNHALIVRAMRAIGASVLDIHQLPNCFDLLIGYRRRTFLFEVKDPAQPPSKRKLTAGELSFKETWKGSEYHVIETVDQAIKVVTEPDKLRETSPPNYENKNYQIQTGAGGMPAYLPRQRVLCEVCSAAAGESR